jgi:hypothetical protein
VREWSLVEKVLAAVAVVVFIGVAVLAVVAWRSGDDDGAVPDGCEGQTLDSDLESDASPVDALRIFVQDRPGDFPVDDSWTTASVEGGTYLFVSDNGGHFEIEVRDGLVRRYLICPD